MAQRKCVICGQPIEDNAESIPYKHRYAHTTCFNNLLKLTTDKENEKILKNNQNTKDKKVTPIKPKIKEAVSEEEYKERQEFFDFLKALIKTDLNVKIYKLTSDYISKYNFTYQGMRKALYYYFYIQEHIPEGDCIGILPYCYDEAQEYFNNLDQINKENEKALNKDPKLYTTKIIKIKPKHINGNSINIEKIGSE